MNKTKKLTQFMRPHENQSKFIQNHIVNSNRGIQRTKLTLTVDANFASGTQMAYELLDTK